MGPLGTHRHRAPPLTPFELSQQVALTLYHLAQAHAADDDWTEVSRPHSSALGPDLGLGRIAGEHAAAA